MIKGLRRSGQRRPQANGKTVALLLDQLGAALATQEIRTTNPVIERGFSLRFQSAVFQKS
jgi:hypothetical protein